MLAMAEMHCCQLRQQQPEQETQHPGDAMHALWQTVVEWLHVLLAVNMPHACT